ncbi:ATP-binding protein [Alkalimonas mucilaginosa]|uniref:histidine kinase n=1 Tax=Alkalimonas mucilaginosa TaxID=3057676 RepID=A0ABU7JJ64_9GAMM|nr:ATP-binding protein [Alkalimonas sp. MEB004]MEE2025739.1 ATP-binding protein [Alkalimonas sp. MEB004]
MRKHVHLLLFTLLWPGLLLAAEPDWYTELMQQSKAEPGAAYTNTMELLAQTDALDWQRRYHLTNALAYQLLILSNSSQGEALIKEWLQQVPPERTEWQIRSYELLAIFAFRRNELVPAQQHLEQAYQLALQHQHHERIASITTNSALLVRSIGLYDEASQLLQQAEQLANRYSLSAATRAIIRNNQSSLLVAMEHYETAIAHLEESLQLAFFQADDIAFVQRTLASSYLALQQYEAASHYASLALDYYLQRDDPYSISQMYLVQAQQALALGALDSAEQKLAQVSQLLAKHSLPENELQAVLLQSQLYQAQQNYPAALEALQQYQRLYSQKQNEQSRRHVVGLRDQLYFQQQQQAIAELESQLLLSELTARHQHRQNITIISALALGTLLLIYFFRRQQQKRIQAEHLTRKLHQSLQQLQQAQQQLIESEKMASLGTLVSGLAHEMNTPLGILTTALSLLDEQVTVFSASARNKQLTQQKFQSFCEKSATTLKLCQQTLQRCSNLVQNIKQLAIRPEQHYDVSLSALIASVRTLLSEQLRGVQVLEEGTELTLHCSGQQLQMVLLELFQNSLQHGLTQEEKPQIRLALEQQTDHLVLRYSDNGCGIEETERQHVFEPFYTTARGAGRTGLGLNLVYNLMTQAFGGSVELTACQTGFELLLYFPKALLTHAPAAANCSSTKQPME